MVGVEQWAEVRRLHRVERLSIREISRRTGLHRKTVRRALAAAQPPRYERQVGGVEARSVQGVDLRAVGADPRIQSQRLREMASEIGYEGGKSIFDEYVREVRPRFLVPRTFQRTIYRPGELVQCDLWEPREPDRGWSRAAPPWLGGDVRGVLVACDRWHAGVQQGGAGHPLGRGAEPSAVGALPEKLVWDRESAIAAGGRPTSAFAGFCGQLGARVGDPRSPDPQAKGALERSHRFMRSNFEPGRVFANHLDFQDRLDAWTEKANGRVHRTIRAVPAERLARGEDAGCGRSRPACRTSIGGR